ncbi:hypothetical protein RD792_004597 [Penstemon davidsonii]|uniref:Histidine kinase/HSP90-like ATPase domain-containing protein n=1 Tax=Penstemon davidsonii TaxID=160366 RepID=A0ABR0DHY4_9LAMI|nr:hypothetical protein RD792_004597 [Penstemon davidsonii]
MLLFTFPPQNPFPNNQYNYTITPLFSPNYNKLPNSQPCRATTNTSAQRPLSLAASSSSTTLRHVSGACDEDEPQHEEDLLVSSAAAVAAAIRSASTSPVEFVQRIEEGGVCAKNKALVLPSQDFQRLCIEQLDLFRRIVDPDALLSAEFFPDLGAVVFPLVTHPFVVGFLVAELPTMALGREWHDIKENPFSKKSFELPQSKEPQPLDVQTFKNHSVEMRKFNTEQKLNAINITRSLAMAYVMDQKAMLLQQSSWQNNVRMSNLVEQIRDSLSSIQTLSKMLSLHMKRSEISYDIVEDILVQGDHMRDTLQQLQDAVYVTKANIMRYNNEALKKMHQSTSTHEESMNSQLSTSLSTNTTISEMQESDGGLSVSSSSKDLEFPMPPLALAPSQPGIRRPCIVSDVLKDLVGAIKPLAHKQRRVVELCDLSRSLHVAVEEPALRQALSNLIEGALLRSETGGRIEIVCTAAPAGGGLIIIDDDGPDMHYMTQMHSLTPFGEDLCAENRIGDNMTWNFVAGLTVAREVLENYGCVVRVVSPRITNPAVGAGGTRVELWLPSFTSSSSDTDTEGFA